MEAVLGMVGLVGAAAVTGFFGFKTAKLQKAVGKPNGKGNVVEMNEKLLEEVGRLHGRLDEHAHQDRESFDAVRAALAGIQAALMDL